MINTLIDVVRKRYLWHFKRDYVSESLSKRKGKCDREKCPAICCKKNAWFCPFLTENGCRIYEKQPFFCKIFPIDEKDIELSRVKDTCTYYW